MQQRDKEKGEKRKATKDLEEFIKAEYSDDELEYEAKKTKFDESIVMAVGTETEELPSTPLIEVPEEASNSLLQRTLTQEEIQEDRPLKRTNSVHLDSDGTEEPIKYSTRNFVNGDSSNIKNMKDGLKIAVFSQEASRNFSRKYHEKVKPGKSYQSHTGQDTSEMDTDISQKLTAKVKYQEGIEEHADAIPQLLENKESPHIIAVVEGKRETLAEEVIVEEGEHSYTYKLHEFYIEGENASGGKDAKQNMHFYIRDDMVHAVTPTVAVIDVGKEGSFKAGEIQFETEAEKYSILVPHIPNKFIGTPEKCIETDNAFRKYEKSSDRTVVGYIGDTNYKIMMQPFSSPSTGGNQGTTYVSPTSSGAQNHTYFMQAVSFDGNKDVEEVSEKESEKSSEKDAEVETKKSSFLMTQPHTLNHIDLQLKDDNTATDHPSIQTTILLNSVIKGRIYANEKTEELGSQKMEGIEVMAVTVDKPLESIPSTDTNTIANFQQLKQKFTAVRVQSLPTLSSEQALKEKNDTSNALNKSF